MGPDSEPDMFADMDIEEEVEEEEDEPVVQLAREPGEKGLPLGYQGKNFLVKEGKRQNTKLYVSGQWAYTYERENSHTKTARPVHPVIHLKCKNWPRDYGKCPARAQIFENDILKLKTGEKYMHNHEPDPDQLRKLEREVCFYVDAIQVYLNFSSWKLYIECQPPCLCAG